MSKVVFIIDIDTTIANNDHRASLLSRVCASCGISLSPSARGACSRCGSFETRIPQESWDDFLQEELIAKDSVEVGAKRTIDAFRKFGFEFHFITGRNGTKANRRAVTEQWLRDNVDWNPDQELLFMRTFADEGKVASVYKEAAFKRLCAAKGYGLYVNFIFFEDDHFVFNTYEKYGIVISSPGCWEFFAPAGATGEEALWRR